MKVYRYPGVRPFQAADKALFFGRDRDIADLYEMVRAERLVVLFGKSGYGKSSLLNAGVLPRLAGAMTPVEVRLGEYIAGQSFPPVETLRRKAPVQRKLKPGTAFLADLPPTLWTHFKQLDSAEKGSYLLVFDQFEEFFSYPPEQQRDFRDQLADLLNGEPPEALREAARALDREQRRLLTAPMDIRVLFAIRSDRMHELDRLKDRLPAILHKRYELKALSREQAREAIIGPAALTDPRPDLREGRITMTPMKDQWAFASPPFEYREDALTKILNGLAVSNTAQQSGVEAFQLQILCDSIENKVAEGSVPDRDGNGLPDVTADDLPDFTEVFAQYYERRLSLLPETERAAARRVIEDGLVRYDPFTDEGRRLSVDGQALLKDYENIGLNPDLLRELENTFLVRREPNTLGGHNYELSHDTLLAPVVRAKKKRMAEEEEQRQGEALAAEEARIAREKADAQRRQKRALYTSVVAGVLVLAAVGASVFAYQQSKKAADATELANQKTRDAEASKLEATAQREEAEQKTFAADEADKRAKRNEEIAALEQKKARTEQENARLMQLKAERAAEQAAIALIDAARRDILQLHYDAAFSKMKNAAGLGSVKDSVAFELMEIAFFRHHAGQSDQAAEPLSMAAKLLGKPGVSADADLEAALKRLDIQRDSFLRARYFTAMIPLKGGTYQMQGEFETTVPGFHMAETETTVWQYNLFCQAIGRDITQRIGRDGKTLEEEKYQPSWGWIGNNPVVYVNWYDAAEYADWLSRKMNRTPAYDIRPDEKDSLNTSDYDDFKWTVTLRENARGYRLPTEAEWEYAAKGGAQHDTFKYSGSDEIDEVAWYYYNSDSRTQAVRAKKANGAGLYDMSGNVFEWCFDWRGGLPAETPRGPKSGSRRVLRGGGWYDDAGYCRPAHRHDSDPDFRTGRYGFRLVLLP